MADRDHDHAVHLPADEEGEDLQLQIVVVGGIADHQVVAAVAGIDLQVGRQLTHERVVQAGHDQAEDVRTALDHRTGDGIRRIAHLLADLEDAAAGLFADLGTAGNGTRDRGVGDVGDFCDIFQGNGSHETHSERVKFVEITIL